MRRALRGAFLPEATVMLVMSKAWSMAVGIPLSRVVDFALELKVVRWPDGGAAWVVDGVLDVNEAVADEVRRAG